MTPAPRVIFMGTPQFACPALRALVAGGLKPSLVVTQPDRRSGRGHSLLPSPVKKLAGEIGVPVFQPATLRDGETQERLRAERPDLIAVAAFGQILPRAVLDIPPRGCINVHASLLPRHRGASPIARAIWEGDAQTGVCIMGMEAGLDTGPVFAREVVAIPADATTGSLEVVLADMGARLLVKALPGILSGNSRAEAQDPSLATLAPRIRREQAEMDFREGSERLARQVRALQPWPVCFVRLSGEEVRVFEVAPGGSAPAGATPGTVLPGPGMAVVCGDGRALHLVRLRRPGRRINTAAELLRGFPVPPGIVLTTGGPP